MSQDNAQMPSGVQRQFTTCERDEGDQIQRAPDQPKKSFHRQRHSTGNLHLVQNKLSDNKHGKRNEDPQFPSSTSIVKKMEEEPVEKVKIVDTSWDLFRKVDQLGSGSFGSVWRVECLESTRLNMNTGNGRVIMN